MYSLSKYCKYVSFCLPPQRQRRRCPRVFSAAFAFLCTGESSKRISQIQLISR